MNIQSSIKPIHILLIAALAAGLALGGPLATIYAAGKTFTVTSTVDAPDVTPGDGKCETGTGNSICTLRAAIQETNALAGADTINLQAGALYVLTRAGDDNTALNGDLDITDDLTINGGGGGAGSSSIDGNGFVTNDRVFDIEKFGGTVHLSGVTIQHGKDSVSRAGGIYNHYGALTLTDSIVKANIGVNGGIDNEDTLTLNNSTISNNTATYGGGGIFNWSGTLTLNNSIVSGNQGVVTGGGIQNQFGAVTLNNSTVSGNQAGVGGGIYTYSKNNSSTVTLINSTLSGNKATTAQGKGVGGGIYIVLSLVTLVNSTVTSNQADYDGGGIDNANGTVNMNNATIAFNAADVSTPGIGGGGVYNESGTVNFRNTLVANNIHQSVNGPVLDECKGSLTSEDYNLILDTTGCAIGGATAHNKIGMYAGLANLANNGGPTATHALLVGSPAIDAGNPSGCKDNNNANLTTDQRGYARLAGVACDVGAYEYGSALAKQNQTISFAALPNKTVGDPPFTVSATASSGLPVTFTASGQCSVNSTTVTLSGPAGSCTITAHQAGNATYNPAPDVARSFAINKQDQTISFAALPDKTVGDPAFSVNASTSSGLPVTFTASGKCSVSGTMVTLTGAGSCTITAHQAGNATYNAAPDVARSFAVNNPAKQNQTISFAALPNKTVGAPPFSVSATASSGLPVTFTASGKCSVNGNTVTLSGQAGSCTVTGHQAGNATYNAAPDVARSFAINDPAKQNQTISFAALPNKTAGTPPFAISATASSGLPVIFMASEQCSVSGNIITLMGAGSCTIIAHQAGNATYNAAADVARTFQISASGPANSTVYLPLLMR